MHRAGEPLRANPFSSIEERYMVLWNLYFSCSSDALPQKRPLTDIKGPVGSIVRHCLRSNLETADYKKPQANISNEAVIIIQPFLGSKVSGLVGHVSAVRIPTCTSHTRS